MQKFRSAGRKVVIANRFHQAPRDPTNDIIRLEEALAAGDGKIARIEADKEKSERLTEKMTGILSSFGDRLDKLEATVRPINRETDLLTTIRDNAKGTLANLDGVLEHYQASRRLSETIKDVSA